MDETRNAGYYDATFGGAGLASGMYFYRLDASAVDGKTQYHQVKRMMLMK